MGTDSAEDVIMVGEMGLAVLAAIDARRVEVDVVSEPHGVGLLGSDVPQGAGSGNSPLVMLLPAGPDAPKAGL